MLKYFNLTIFVRNSFQKTDIFSFVQKLTLSAKNAWQSLSSISTIACKVSVCYLFFFSLFIFPYKVEYLHQ